MFIHQMAQVWNNNALAFTGIKLNVTDTASDAASLLQDLQVGGVSKFSVRKDGLVSAVNFLTSAELFVGAVDVALVRDGAADILALRRSTNPQTFNLYNTWTDATHNEGGGLTWSGDTMYLRTFKGAAGGVYQSMGIVAPTITFFLKASPTAAWSMDVNGNFVCPTDNTFDIGASGATRPRTGYFGTSVIVPAIALGATSAALKVGTHSAIGAETVTGFITIKDSAGNDRKIAVVS